PKVDIKLSAGRWISFAGRDGGEAKRILSPTKQYPETDRLAPWAASRRMRGNDDTRRTPSRTPFHRAERVRGGARECLDRAAGRVSPRAPLHRRDRVEGPRGPHPPASGGRDGGAGRHHDIGTQRPLPGRGGGGGVRETAGGDHNRGAGAVGLG